MKRKIIAVAVLFVNKAAKTKVYVVNTPYGAVAACMN